jgi:colanic acid biosynthesis glycosyl transferase WcaI
MRIHIVTNLFAPDELAGAALFTDLALYLKERGHEVRVTGTFSYYPAWKRRPEDQGLSWCDDCYEGIPVRRLGMFVPRKPTGKSRMISDLSFLLALIRRGTFRAWDPEVVLTALPMLSQCLAQRFLYRGKRIPRLIVVQDFVVDSALELGILRLPGLSQVLRHTERWALRSAATLLTISPSMLEKLRRVVGPDRRACYSPNWIHRSLQREIDRQANCNGERLPKSLFYAGNLGVKQGLPGFLRQFRDASTGWSLRIHGGGAERDRLALEVERSPGCTLGPVLEEAEYVSALRACTACLVTQCAGVGSNFLPSKLLPALATGTPVLAVCDVGSPLGREVTKGGYGEVIPPGQPALLARLLDQWQRQPSILRGMRERASMRAPVFHRERVLPHYEHELLALIRGAPSNGRNDHFFIEHCYEPERAKTPSEGVSNLLKGLSTMKERNNESHIPQHTTGHDSGID